MKEQKKKKKVTPKEGYTKQKLVRSRIELSHLYNSDWEWDLSISIAINFDGYAETGDFLWTGSWYYPKTIPRTTETLSF